MKKIFTIDSLDDWERQQVTDQIREWLEKLEKGKDYQLIIEVIEESSL